MSRERFLLICIALILTLVYSQLWLFNLIGRNTDPVTTRFVMRDIKTGNTVLNCYTPYKPAVRVKGKK